MTQSQNSNVATADNNSCIRILLVDNDPSLLEIFEKILTDIDDRFELDCACCVDEAFKKLSARHYDVVISDYEMPQKDGLQFLKELREQNKGIPFILFTGKGREEVVIQALNLGADGYHNKQGNPETVYGELAYNLLSLVEKTKTKKALEESEKRYRALMEQASEAIFIHNIHGRLIDVNEKACRTLGYSKEELLKMAVIDIDGDATDNQKGLMWPKVVGGESFTFESSHKRKDGSIFPVEVSLGPIVVDDKILVMELSKDITEQRKTTEALRESKVNYVNLINGMSETVWVIDFDGNFVDVNDAAVKVLGYSKEELMSIGIRGIDNYLSQEQVKNLIERLPNVGTHVFETVHTAKDGKKIPVEICSSLIVYQGKQAVLSIARNITERKKIEVKLRESHKKYQDLTETTSDFIWETDPQGRYTYCSPQMEILWGLKPKEMIGKTPFDVMPPKDRVKALEYFGELSNSPKPFNMESSAYHRQGHLVYLETNGVPFFDGQGVFLGFRGISRDITEHKKAEEQLEESENRYRAIVELCPDGIVTINLNGTITSANKAFLDLTGFSAEEIVGKNFVRLPTLRKRDLPKYVKIFADVIRGNISSSYEFGYVRKDGSDCEAEARFRIIRQKSKITVLQIYLRDLTEVRKYTETLVASKLELQREKNILQSIIDGAKDMHLVYMDRDFNFVRVNEAYAKSCRYEPYEMIGKNYFALYPDKINEAIFRKVQDTGVIAQFCDKPFVFPDQSERGVTYWDWTLEPVKDDLGKVEGLVFSLVETTQRKRVNEALKKNSDAISIANEKLRVVGGLTRHDVGNKLSAILGYTYLLKKKYADQSDIVEGLGKMERTVADSVRIFEFAKIYEQLGVEELTFVNVETTFNDALAFFSSLTFKVANNCQGLTVLADSFVTKLFYNLIENTRKYGIKTTTIKLHYEKTDQDSLKLVYEDDGVGISADNKLKLFSKGFSTGNSTGYGLFLIKKMMDIYGWTITEEGEPGKGAKFTITIPKLNKSGKENY